METSFCSITKSASDHPNKELLAEVFPNLPQIGDVGEHTTLLNIDKAKKVLGYAPQYSWREYVKAFV